MEDVLIAKTASILIIFCGSLFFGLLPAFSVFSTFPRFALSLILSYGGGILIATSLVHILPEAQQAWPNSPFTAEMGLCVGIFIVYIIEEVAHFLVCHDIHSPLGHGHGELDGHNHGVHVHHDDPPNRCDEPAVVFLFAEKNSRSAGDLEHDHETHNFLNHNHHHHCTSDGGFKNANEEDGVNHDCSGDGRHVHHKNGKKHSSNNPISDQTAVKLFQEPGNDSKILADENNRKTPAPNPIVVKLRSLVGLIALSVHAGLEGLSVGLGRDASDVWYLCGAVAAHKLVIAFCLGMEVRIASTKNSCSNVQTSSSASFKCRYIIFFSLMTPLGIAVGTIITEFIQEPQKTESTVVAVLQALAAGTLLYVAFFEVILRERARFSGKGLAQLALVILGWATMIVVEITLQSQGHSHSPAAAHVESNHDHDVHDHHSHSHPNEGEMSTDKLL